MRLGGRLMRPVLTGTERRRMDLGGVLTLAVHGWGDWHAGGACCRSVAPAYTESRERSRSR